MTSRRLRRTFRHWPLLLTSMALAIAGATSSTASAQEQTARLVKDANRTTVPYGGGIGWVLPLGEKRVVFARDTYAHGYELWTSNGTPGSTRLLKDLMPGPGGSALYDPMAFGEGASAKVAFVFSRPGISNEVWVTDGTEAGTVAVAELDPGPYSTTTLMPGPSGGFFFLNHGEGEEFPQELHFSDGTAAGTGPLNPTENGEPVSLSNAHSYLISGRWCYFTANRNQIWRSDGTATGTTKVTEIPLAKYGSLSPALVTGERLILSVSNLATDLSELWTCNAEGTGIRRILAAPAGAEWWRITDLIPSGDRLLFTVWDEIYNYQLWVSDGTEAGTHEIELPREDGHVTRQLTFARWHGAVYVLAEYWDDIDADYILFRTDGTAAGTRRLRTFSHDARLYPDAEWREDEPFFYFRVASANGEWTLWRTAGDAASTVPAKGLASNHYLRIEYPAIAATKSGKFFAAGNALWFQRGKKGGAVRLTRPEKWTASGAATFNSGILPVGEESSYEMLDGKLLAFVDTGSGHELWRMNPDGRGHGTRAIWKTPAPLQEYGAVAFRGTTASGAIFIYTDGKIPPQLWVTNGTPRGTRLLVDHGATPGWRYPYEFVSAGGVLFYSLRDGTGSPATLWKTDGTPAGTKNVVAADGRTPGPDYPEMVAFQDGVAFLSWDWDGRRTLWRSDGTPAGTVPLKDSWAGGSPMGLAAVDGKLIFSVEISRTQVLWQSDGTAAGTIAVDPAVKFTSGGMSLAFDVGGVALFRGRQGQSSNEDRWWRHDATGTRRVENFVTGQHFSDTSHPWKTQHAVAGAHLFYRATTPNGTTLWVTDGTSDGTRPVVEPDAGSFSYPTQLLAVGDVVYFSAYDQDHGNELWRSDGTAAGTVLVADIDPGPADSDPRGLKVMGGKLYFTAHRRDVGREIFVVDLPAR
ncbi:hypothetical protein OKA05_27175 [Luteolibacter arcticus]|uniref:Bulb-type lectin domain-containing protein n=1 Tax=Luteolibacter arcticus TaxID=1581411 RepID=A0ABT3GRV9_9BACT|nr:ELWxxDGT repeat protein [Luteolibacter arcticus]MCW1926266.1 hypothetical protein [Luteolibacter arcticus]